MFDCFVCHGGEGSSDERVKFGVILGGVVSSAAFSGGGEGCGGGDGGAAARVWHVFVELLVGWEGSKHG